MSVIEADKAPRVGAPLGSNDDLKRRISSRLFVAAWSIEVIAAAIGLFIAVATAFATRAEIMSETAVTRLDAAGWLSVFIGGLPFLMIAIVELMKIPLATATYLAGSLIWRAAFGLSLAFLVVITFETMLNGFQRNFEDRIFAVTQAKTRLLALDERIVQTSAELDRLSALSIEVVQRDYDQAREQTRKTRDAQIAEIESQRRSVTETSAPGSSTALSASVQNLQQEIARLREQEQSELGKLEQSYLRELEQSSSSSSQQQQRLDQSLSELARQASELSARREVELQGCMLTCATVRESYERRFASLEQQRQQILAQKGQLTNPSASSQLRREHDERLVVLRKTYAEQIARSQRALNDQTQQLDRRQNQNQASLKPLIEALDRRRQEIVSAADLEMRDAKERFEQRAAEVEQREKATGLLQQNLAKLEHERLEIRSEINDKARANQIYQIAALLYGKDAAADITKDELKWVSILWFGSLSAIVALTGTILAFAGLVIRHNRSSANTTMPSFNRRSPFVRSVRILAIAYGRRAKRPRLIEKIVEVPREIIKEVAVDRIAFRDVPQEIVRKELVYVPFYTNDKSLLNFQERLRPTAGAAE